MVGITKRRKDLLENPLFPSLGELLRVKKGSKISRFFRHIFQHTKIKKLVGANLAVMIVASSLMPSTSATYAANDDLAVTESPIVLTTQKSLQNPVKVMRVTQGYRFYHPALDLDGVTGDEIRSIMPGYVEAVEYSRYGYGNSIIVNHGDNLTSLYAHLSKINVVQGQEVGLETKLGEMGATGRSFGDHLHLEVKDNGRAINPYSVLPR